MSAAGPARRHLLLALCVASFGVGPCDLEARRADVNADGYVDIFDATLVGTCMMIPPGSDPRCSRADVEVDGDVDASDFVAVQNHFGTVLFAQVPFPYSPASIHLGEDDVLYLHSPQQNLIHRWSLPTRRPLAPIQIGVSSRYLAYSSANHSLYVAYEDRRITRIDASFPVEEVAFATLTGPPLGLATADPYLVGVDSGGVVSHHTFAPDGRRISTRTRNFRSREFAWNAAKRRLYHFRDGTGVNDLLWEAIHVGGQLAPGGESPYHGDYAIAPPIRISHDGLRVLLGSGDIYDGISLQVIGTLPVQPVDAVWLRGFELLTLETASVNTLLVHWDRDGRLYNLQRYEGQPLRVFEWEAGYVVVTLVEGRPTVHTYVPTDDADGDGVINTEDDHPLDPAASQDRDGDGYPDVWNPGRGPGDSSEGLTLDAFPDDPECQLAEHARPGHPGVCDHARAIPVYTPSRIEVDAAGTIYLLSSQNRRIYRWSLAEDYHLEPIELGDDPRHLAYSHANDRLYVGYGSGAITQIDPGAAHEAPFAGTPGEVLGLQTAGSYVFAVDPTGAGVSHYTFAPNGTPISAVASNRFSYGFEWSPANGRIYYTRDDTSPNDIHWTSIDAAGRIGATGDSPYHGQYSMHQPVRVSRNGALVLLGSGDLYRTPSLQLADSLPFSLADALWLGDGSLITIRDAGDGRTLLEHWSASLDLYSSGRYAGTPLRVLESGGEIAVVTLTEGRPAVHAYVPTDDADGDGVINSEDDFPLDPAASQDRDGDGYPDAWNPGLGPEDSLEGLVLDAFPHDSACQHAEQARPGQPNVCDIERAIPEYTPTELDIDTAGIVYLLSPENDRIYRWSVAEDDHLNPIEVADNPAHLTYSAANDRLYVGYASGAITQIDPSAESLREVPFATTPGAVTGLQAAGRYVFAVDPSGLQTTHYTFASTGTRISAVDRNHTSKTFSWSSVNRRMYFTRDQTTTNDIHWESIDTMGRINGSGESPYHGDYPIGHPVRVSRDGAFVLLGVGDIYDAHTLEISRSLTHAVTDALWLMDGSLATIRDAGNGRTLLEHREIELSPRNGVYYPGAPLGVLGRQGETSVVTLIAGRPAVHSYVPSDDGDGDGVVNTDDGFPLDPAASQDHDRDGAPDAWNPGHGPEDSLEGLVLDAFPNDSTCQLPQHGSGSVCDIPSVLPVSLDQAFCELDTAPPTAASGWIELGDTGDFVPLCDGWLLIGEVGTNRIAVRNVVTGRTGAFFSMPSAPGDLELDEEAKLLYVALPDQLALAELELLTGQVRMFHVGIRIASLSLGPDGGLFIGVPDVHRGTLHWLAPDATEPVGGWLVYGQRVLWNRVHGELVVALTDYEYGTSLHRYRFDPAMGPSLLQSRNPGTHLSGHDLALSGDGTHLAFAMRARNDTSIRDVFDYAPNDLALQRGKWPSGPNPRGVAFDRASTRLLASTSGDLRVFDVATYAELDRLSAPFCAGSEVPKVAFSRGGSLAFGKQMCGPSDPKTRYFWLATD